ncbi:MAG: DUF2231 domain-containing protein [Chloroflexota bacterium]
MTLKKFLQGTWLGHPLHPALVHAPTGLWTAALVFDVLTVLGVGGNPLLVTSYYALLVGFIAALFAVPTGLADWWDIGRDKPARRLGLIHMLINVVVTLLALANLFLRAGEALELTAVPTTPLLLSALMVGLLAISGYLGGRMTFAYGTSVARQSKPKWRERAEAGGAHMKGREEISR